MSRLMSVAMTTDAVIERRKTVSRRANWWVDKNGRRLLHVGDQLTLCKKVQGRKPGEPIFRLAEVEATNVRREPLGLLSGHMDPTEYGLPGTYAEDEVAREGFPGMAPVDFVDRFFVQAQGITDHDDVTRIEWRYIEACQACSSPAPAAHTPCCSSHGKPLCCVHYCRYHFVEVNRCTPASHGEPVCP